MNFTKTGTLKEWVIAGKNIIPTLREITLGTTRGGAFLCIPNFEELPYPFLIKHGEYRKEEGTERLPHQKIIEAKEVDAWGALSVSTMWKETTLGEKTVLTVTSTIGALSEKLYLRPGFHPYFTVSPTFNVTLLGKNYTEKTFPNKTMIAVPFPKGTQEPRAILTTETHVITLACRVLDMRESEEFYFSFALWTDNLEKYICIEPVIGGTSFDKNLPTPFILPKENQLTFFFEITATPR